MLVSGGMYVFVYLLKWVMSPPETFPVKMGQLQVLSGHFVDPHKKLTTVEWLETWGVYQCQKRSQIAWYSVWMTESWCIRSATGGIYLYRLHNSTFTSHHTGMVGEFTSVKIYIFFVLFRGRSLSKFDKAIFMQKNMDFLSKWQPTASTVNYN